MSNEELMLFQELLIKFAKLNDFFVYHDCIADNIEEYKKSLYKAEYYKAFRLLNELICYSYN